MTNSSATCSQDESLLEKWNAGDARAFGDLFQTHAAALYNLAYRLTSNHEDARDLLQTAALRAFSSSSRCRDGASFYSWMRRIVTHLFLDSRKASHRAGRDLVVDIEDWEQFEMEGQTDATSQSPREDLEDKMNQEKVEWALSQLATGYRTLIILREIEGLSYADIAAELNIPLETVRTGLRRARIQLRGILTPLVELGEGRSL